jgi:S-formylglutathione hydrolase FrmB
VQPPGHAWGIAGYSEGGFCAANLGLQNGCRYGYVAVLSGYFKPSDNQLAHPARMVSPFGGNVALRRRNTPVDLLESLRPGAPVPQFWLGTGALDHADTKDAEIFAQLVQSREPGVTLKVVPDARHTMLAWRALVPPMLEWMTPRLATEAQLAGQRAHGRRGAHSARSPGCRHSVPARPIIPATPTGPARKHHR